jgi:hypothetical protein
MPKSQSSSTPHVAITPEQRSHLIEDMAVFREQQRRAHGTPGDHERCRREAQAALNAILRDMAQQRWPR